MLLYETDVTTTPHECRQKGSERGSNSPREVSEASDFKPWQSRCGAIAHTASLEHGGRGQVSKVGGKDGKKRKRKKSVK